MIKNISLSLENRTPLFECQSIASRIESYKRDLVLLTERLEPLNKEHLELNNKINHCNNTIERNKKESHSILKTIIGLSGLGVGAILASLFLPSLSLRVITSLLNVCLIAVEANLLKRRSSLEREILRNKALIEKYTAQREIIILEKAPLKEELRAIQEKLDRFKSKEVRELLENIKTLENADSDSGTITEDDFGNIYIGGIKIPKRLSYLF